MGPTENNTDTEVMANAMGALALRPEGFDGLQQEGRAMKYSLTRMR